MGVPDGGKVYNSMTLSITVPNKEANKQRGIPILKMTNGNTEFYLVDFSTVYLNRDAPQTYIFFTYFENKTLYSYDLATDKMTPLSSLPVKHMKSLGQHPSDITLTLQGTYAQTSILI